MIERDLWQNKCCANLSLRWETKHPEVRGLLSLAGAEAGDPARPNQIQSGRLQGLAGP